MPIYVYHCLMCEADFEEKYSFDQIDEHPPCPICHGRFTVRGLSSFSFFSSGRESNLGETTATSALSHGPDCLCCYPRSTPSKNRHAQRTRQH
ncbi:MAG TPA: zinc ribbon domain-containing protein [Anaerolineae bacterium]|nr:zinc ribbon domain-containing protein [Anaerolineae bacterium]HMR67263.1 zinc ribbon domain-containing protein [Anaerolineae bacterium]